METISLTPVEKRCPVGQEKLTTEPNVVPVFDMIAPLPGCSWGQSAEKTAENPGLLLVESVVNLMWSSPRSAE